MRKSRFEPIFGSLALQAMHDCTMMSYLKEATWGNGHNPGLGVKDPEGMTHVLLSDVRQVSEPLWVGSPYLSTYDFYQALCFRTFFPL